MRKRKRESILRTNKVKLTTDPEKYYHALLMFYLPWCSEETLKGTYEIYEEHHHNVKHIVDHNAQHFNHNSEHIDNAIDALIENGPPETSWDTVAPIIEEENANILSDGFHMRQFGNRDSDISEDSESVDKQRHTHKSWLSMQYTMEAHKDIMSPSQYGEHLRNLNPGQRQIVMYNRAWCKAAVIAHKKGKSINPYRVFLSGPGGTGKCHVINLIRRDVIYFSS